MESTSNILSVLFLIDQINPGGSEKQLIWLAENLPRNKYKPIIAVLNHTQYQDKLKIKTPIIVFSSKTPPGIRGIIRLLKIKRFISQKNIRIVQTYFPTACILGTLAARLNRNRPFIISTRRNLYHWVNESHIEYWLFRITAPWADIILANSWSVAKIINQFEHINENKIKVIQNGIECDKYLAVTNEVAKSELGITDNYPIIGMIGNWRHIKGASIFINSCELIKSKYPGAKFILVGSGTQENELKRLANTLGIRDNVIFIEGRTDVERLIPAFDVAVQPSLSESFSNVLIEYMAAGRPIVATRVGDAEYIMEDGVEGVLVSPGNYEELGNAIIELCNKKSESEKMGDLAKRKVNENWKSEIIMSQYIHFYEHLKLL